MYIKKIKLLELFITVIVILCSYIVPLYSLGYTSSNFKSFDYAFIFILAVSFIVLLSSEYTEGGRISKSRNILKVLLNCSFIAMAIMAIAFFVRGFAFPRGLIIIAAVIQISILIPLRIYFRKKNRGLMYHNTLIIGVADEKDWLYTKALNSKLPKEQIKAYFLADKRGLELEQILSEYTKVFISDNALKELSEGQLTKINLCNIELVVIPRKYEISIWSSVQVPLEDSIAMGVKKLGLSFDAQILKRIFDIAFSLVAIIISFPIMCVVAVAIFLEDKQNPFFIQERITRNNRKFKLIKFRSMRIDAELETGAIWAHNEDERITKVGKIIRATWLDELPQFFNVLIGDMSIVGPRPERQELIDSFSSNTPEFKYRTNVKAGITGYAQVLTNYGTLPENKLKLDLLYIRKWSMIFDLLIIIETVRKIMLKILPTQRAKEVYTISEEYVDTNYIRYKK